MPTATPFAFVHPEAGFLRVTGADRISFIQRQTTNDVQDLPPDRYVSTILTNPSARIIDVLQVFAEEGDTLGVVTLPGRGASTAFFLKRRVFFMDKVAITDASQDIRVIDLEGAGAADGLEAFGISAPGNGMLTTGQIAGAQVRIAGQTGPGGPSFRIISSAQDAGPVIKALEAGGIRMIDAAEYERLRILAGIPGALTELTEDYTPLETGLDDMISATKGCYTGQEVIARQITYDKITRSLVGVIVESPVTAGARVLVGEQSVGTVTSYAESEDTGRRALAVIKRPHFEPGTAVRIESNGSFAVGVVAALPFPLLNR